MDPTNAGERLRLCKPCTVGGRRSLIANIHRFGGGGRLFLVCFCFLFFQGALSNILGEPLQAFENLVKLLSKTRHLKKQSRIITNHNLIRFKLNRNIPQQRTLTSATVRMHDGVPDFSQLPLAALAFKMAWIQDALDISWI